LNLLQSVSHDLEEYPALTNLLTRKKFHNLLLFLKEKSRKREQGSYDIVLLPQASDVSNADSPLEAIAGEERPYQASEEPERMPPIMMKHRPKPDMKVPD
jgi:hypothetical protein